MDRRQFMMELGTGLFKTIREVAAPFIESDLKKLSRLADRWAGYDYQPLVLPESGVFADAWVSGEPLLLHKENGRWAVYSGRCPACGKVLQYLAYADRVTCFGCNSEYGWVQEEAASKKAAAPNRLSGTAKRSETADQGLGTGSSETGGHSPVAESRKIGSQSPVTESRKIGGQSPVTESFETAGQPAMAGTNGPEASSPSTPGLKRLPLRLTNGQTLVGLPGKEKAHA